MQFHHCICGYMFYLACFYSLTSIKFSVYPSVDHWTSLLVRSLSEKCNKCVFVFLTCLETQVQKFLEESSVLPVLWLQLEHPNAGCQPRPLQCRTLGRHKQVNLITGKCNMICHKSFILFSGAILECCGNATIILENYLCIAVVFQLIW